MKKHLLLVAAALAASTPILVQPEPAEAGFLRRALFGHRHGLMRHRHHHHFHLRRRVIIAPVIVAPVVTAPATRAPARTSKATPSAPRNSDGSGRTFDPASMAWTDGNQCWSGTQRWAFRSGWWFYGSHRWYPVDGTWRTDAPDAPRPIDCQSVAAFARPVPTTTTAAPLSEETGRAEASNTPATECTKYLSSIGRVIKTACGG